MRKTFNPLINDVQRILVVQITVESKDLKIVAVQNQGSITWNEASYDEAMDLTSKYFCNHESGEESSCHPDFVIGYTEN